MADGSEIRRRIIAMSGAVVFIISICALTVAVILQMVQDGKQKEVEAQAASCQNKQAEEVLEAPEAFKPEGDVTKLETKDIKKGDGQEVKKGDCLHMKYYGTLAKDGTKFDENYTTPTAFAVVIGTGQVIQGWDQGLIGMKVGGERRLVIPSDLAYGAQGSGSTIPPDADLVFQVKLIRIQK